MGVLAVATLGHPATWISAGCISVLCAVLLVPVSYRMHRLSAHPENDSH